MQTLQNGRVTVLIDPDRGLTVRSLRIDGRECMATVAWEQDEPAERSTPEHWVRAWAGGWQPTLPNAGYAAPNAVVPQGYHGEASQQPWTVTGHDDQVITATWRDAGPLEVERQFVLQDDGLLMRCAATNQAAQPRPMVITEHLVLGSDLLAGGASVEAPGATVYPLSPDQEQLAGSPWPGVDEPDWSVARAGESPARCAAVTAPIDGVVVRSGPAAVRLTWDSTALPYFWLWQELAANPDPPWDGKTLALGVEPSTTPHGQGLDVAAPAGECAVIAPGASLSWWIRITAA
jgi:galactose mutarotase-like enzyme